MHSISCIVWWGQAVCIYIFAANSMQKGIYQALTKTVNGGTIAKYDHWIHCLDSLRQHVIYAADYVWIELYLKTRREINFVLQELLFVTEHSAAKVGDGHVRQCKDFSNLDKWALEHHACCTFEDLNPPFFKYQRWRACPKDSPYFQTMREFLGYNENWEPDYEVHLGPTSPDGLIWSVEKDWKRILVYPAILCYAARPFWSESRFRGGRRGAG